MSGGELGHPIVRVAGAEDAEAVTALLVEFRDWLGRDEPSAERLRAGVDRLLADPGCEYLLAAPAGDGAAAGVAQLRYRYGLWYSAEDCWLEDLFVREAERGAGLGSALVEAAVERAQGRGCRRIELDTESDNATALALYARNGFSAETHGGTTRLMLRRPLDRRTTAP